MSKDYLRLKEPATPISLALATCDIFVAEAKKHKLEGNKVEEQRHLEKARRVLMNMIEAVALS